jgi:ribonuclease VapC
MSAASYVETTIVVDARRDPALSRDFDRLIAPIAIAEVTAAQSRLARQAYRDFCKGTGHPAQLTVAIALCSRLRRKQALLLRCSGADFPFPARPRPSAGLTENCIALFWPA